MATHDNLTPGEGVLDVAEASEGPIATSRTRTFASAAGVMVILSTVASMVNYGSNLAFGRLLSPADYGELTALLSLVTIVTVPIGAAQTIVAERLATLRAMQDLARVRFLIRYGAAHVTVISVIAGVLYAVAIPLVVSVFHIAVLGPALATLPLLVASFFVPFAQGVLQGLERFVVLGVLLVVAAASRIAIGVPWTLLTHGGAGGALGGQALGNVIAVFATWWAVRDQHLPRGTGAARAGSRRRIDSRAFYASLAYIAFAILSNLDILLAKAFLHPTQSGQYAALVTIEKLVLFLPGAVTTVMVPSAARARVEAGSARRVLRISSAVILGTSLLAAIPAASVPRLVLVSMFGHRYAGASSGVLPMVAAGIGFSMLDLLVVYTVTVGYKPSTYLLLGAVPAQAIAITIFHRSATEVAAVQAGVVLGTLLINELLFHPLVLRSRTRSRDSS